MTRFRACHEVKGLVGQKKHSLDRILFEESLERVVAKDLRSSHSMSNQYQPYS